MVDVAAMRDGLAGEPSVQQLGTHFLQVFMREFVAMQEKVAELEGVVALGEESTAQRIQDLEDFVSSKHEEVCNRVDDLEKQLSATEDSLLETFQRPSMSDSKIDIKKLADMDQQIKDLEKRIADTGVSWVETQASSLPSKAAGPEVVPQKAIPAKKAPHVAKPVTEKAWSPEPTAEEARVPFKAMPAKKAPPTKPQPKAETELPEQGKPAEVNVLPVKAPPAKFMQKAAPPSVVPAKSPPAVLASPPARTSETVPVKSPPPASLGGTPGSQAATPEQAPAEVPTLPKVEISSPEADGDLDCSVGGPEVIAKAPPPHIVQPAAMPAPAPAAQPLLVKPPPPHLQGVAAPAVAEAAVVEDEPAPKAAPAPKPLLVKPPPPHLLGTMAPVPAAGASEEEAAPKAEPVAVHAQPVLVKPPPPHLAHLQGAAALAPQAVGAETPQPLPVKQPPPHLRPAAAVAEPAATGIEEGATVGSEEGTPAVLKVKAPPPCLAKAKAPPPHLLGVAGA